jgi:hypothetical protein
MAIAFLVTALLSLVLSQPTGQISGTVRDETGGALPTVTVTVSGPTLEKPRTTVTSARGTYAIAGLPAGIYVVAFSLNECFRPVRRSDVRVTVDTVTVDAVLRLSRDERCIVV